LQLQLSVLDNFNCCSARDYWVSNLARGPQKVVQELGNAP